MYIVLVILVIIVCALLGLIVLIQNPKGGGLAGNFAGISNQFMGVKQTTDVLEKGTWTFAGIIAVLCIVSKLFIGDASDNLPDNTRKGQNAPIPGTGQPAQTAPVNPIVPDSNK